MHLVGTFSKFSHGLVSLAVADNGITVKGEILLWNLSVSSGLQTVPLEKSGCSEAGIHVQASPKYIYDVKMLA